MKRKRFKRQKDIIQQAVKKAIGVTPEERYADYVLRLSGKRLSIDGVRKAIKHAKES